MSSRALIFKETREVVVRQMAVNLYTAEVVNSMENTWLTCMEAGSGREWKVRMLDVIATRLLDEYEMQDLLGNPRAHLRKFAESQIDRGES